MLKRSLQGQINTLKTEREKIVLKLNIIQLELKQINSYLRFLQKEENESSPTLKDKREENIYIVKDVEDDLFIKYFQILQTFIDYFLPLSRFKAEILIEIQGTLVRERVLDLSPISGDLDLVRRIRLVESQN